MTPPDINIDDAEIARFEAMAPRWWDRSGDFKALHDINPVRLAYIESRAGLAGKQVLDVGCGGGILSEAMAGAGAVVTGIDMGPAPLAVARLHGRQSGLAIDYRLTTCEALAETHAGRFDLVTCLEMLEHVPHPLSVIKACKELLKPGGDLFFATVNRTLKSFLLAIVAAEYLLGLVARGTHTFDRFIKPSEITRWARRAGLERRDLTGLQYNPLLKTCRLGGSTAVNYLMHFRRSETSGAGADKGSGKPATENSNMVRCHEI